jgi:hypothetical protein
MKKMSLVLIAVVMSFSSLCLGQKASLLFPVIVAQRALTGQTSNIPPTTLLKPKKSGLFRISAYGIPTATDQSSEEVSVDFTYSDDVGPVDQPFDIFAGGTGCLLVGNENRNWNCTYSVVIRAVAGVPIQFATTIMCDGSCNVTYDLFITMEQLQ